jgi:hypothetical protein
MLSLLRLRGEKKKKDGGERGQGMNEWPLKGKKRKKKRGTGSPETSD